MEGKSYAWCVDVDEDGTDSRGKRVEASRPVRLQPLKTRQRSLGYRIPLCLLETLGRFVGLDRCTYAVVS